MMLISRLKRKKKKKGSQEDPKCLSLKMELDARNNELETLKEEQTKELNIKNEEAAVLRAKIEDLTSRNADSLVQLEEMRKKCSDFEEQLNKNNKKKEMHLTFSQPESAGMRPSTTTTIKGKSEEEILEMVTQLQQTNKELHAALAMEKKKSQRRRQEASERRAKFKQRVQTLTRKLSDDSSSSEEDDENDAILPAPTHSANNTPRQGDKNKLIGIEISV